MTVELTDGNQYTFERTELKEKAALFAWVQNKKYAMTSSDSGISLAFERGTPNDYIFSVKEISFVSDPS